MINGGRPTWLTLMTTTPEDKQDEATTTTLTHDDEAEPRRQHPMTISP